MTAPIRSMPELISRKEALARGLKRFFQNERCGKGHIAERFTSNRFCAECGKREIKIHECLICARPFRKKGSSKCCSARCISEKNKARNKVQYRLKKKEMNKTSRKWARDNPSRASAISKKSRQKNPEKYLEGMRKYRLIASSNPKGEKSWLRKAQAYNRNLRRLLRHPNQDHSSWLTEAPKT